MEIKIKPTITQQKLNYYLYFGILAVACAILIITSSFLYKNFYQTITESNFILNLKSQVANEMVNTQKFNLIIEKFEKKTKAEKKKISRDPFKKNALGNIVPNITQ